MVRRPRSHFSLEDGKTSCEVTWREKLFLFCFLLCVGFFLMSVTKPAFLNLELSKMPWPPPQWNKLREVGRGPWEIIEWGLKTVFGDMVPGDIKWPVSGMWNTKLWIRECRLTIALMSSNRQESSQKREWAMKWMTSNKMTGAFRCKEELLWHYIILGLS